MTLVLEPQVQVVPLLREPVGAEPLVVGAGAGAGAGAAVAVGEASYSCPLFVVASQRRTLP